MIRHINNGKSKRSATHTLLFNLGGKRVTCEEVADLAKCSKSTVSKYLDNTDMTAEKFIEFWRRRTDAKKKKKGK